MIKFRITTDIDNIESFLNEMAAQGYAMVKLRFGFYHFDKSKPSEYTYRVDLINDKSRQERKKYFDLIEKTGVELMHQGASLVVFRKKGSFKLHQNKERVLLLYKKIRKLYWFLACSLIPLLVAVIVNYFLVGKNSTPGEILSIFMAILLALIILILASSAHRYNKKINNLEKNME